ncbi:MAG: trypsin-like peptidase domain-containing protein [Spirochaetes bacterium]|nr:trypsin-like peptidase domain-containing protein [Spirochaetota bacterium]
MRKKLVLPAVCLAVFVLTVISCATSTVKDSKNIEKVDKKIISEFTESSEAGEFFNACGSYIEYLNCCNDERIYTLTESLENLYLDKMKKLKADGDTMEMIRYSHSFVNVTARNIPESRSEQYRADLVRYVRQYADVELSGKEGLEKASWLLFLIRFSPDVPELYLELSKLFLDRKNALLSRKYFDIYIGLAGNGDEETKRLGEEISGLEAETSTSESRRVDAIENVIKSSVKIFVDKGIKTEMGVGRPDQLLGTGVVIDRRGYIITNYHIIESSVDPKYEGYSRVYVIPGKDESIRYIAKIVGYDSVFDLALLKIEKEYTTHIQLGDSDTLRRGDKIVAIGNPAGLTNTVTSGVISSLDRPFFQIGNTIQIDAALNPGNSGGALIDESGYLVGIAFAGLEEFQNLNFVIPSNLMISILFKLHQGGEVKRSWMGCYAGERENGVALEYIVPDGPASIFRFNRGDLISEVNGVPVTGIFGIQDALSLYSDPVVATLKIRREDDLLTRYVLVDERPLFPSELIFKKDAQENVLTPLFGMVVDKVEEPGSQSYVVKRILSSSVASNVGISEGDTIRLKKIKYDENSRVFSLLIELKSKRFGFMNKPIILYSRTGVSNFI